MARFTPKKEDWKPRVIELIASGCTVTDAARECGISRNNIYQYADKNEEFKQTIQRAYADSADYLEAEARRRAIHGVVRKKFDKGVPIIDPATGEQYTEREYSDTLLIFLLKGRRPEVFGERVRVDHAGKPFDAESAATDLLAEITRRLGGNGARTGPRAADPEPVSN